MDIDLEIIVETNLDPSVDVQELERLVKFVLEHVGARGAWTIAVVLSDDARLRELHRRFMGIDSTTDVMTFPLGDGGDRANGGDIVVSVERATEQAVDFGLSAADEVRFLVVHGLLHLRSWDDRDEGQREQMWKEQRRLLAAFDHSELRRQDDPTRS